MQIYNFISFDFLFSFKTEILIKSEGLMSETYTKKTHSK